MDCLSFVGFSNIVISLSAAGASLVAWLGLKGWKDQRFWEIDHELARRLLTNIGPFRGAITKLRQPSIMSFEMPAPSKKTNTGLPEKQKTLDDTVIVYQKRIEVLVDISNKIRVDMNEASVLWGTGFLDKFTPIFALQSELLREISLYFETISPDNSSETRNSFQNLYDDTRSIMYNSYRDDDVFTVELESAILELEKEIRPYLGRGK